jgi:hypothetical protein
MIQRSIDGYRVIKRLEIEKKNLWNWINNGNMFYFYW